MKGGLARLSFYFYPCLLPYTEAASGDLKIQREKEQAEEDVSAVLSLATQDSLLVV